MDDDFNTPEALAVLFDLARDVNRAREQHRADGPALGALLRSLGGVLGLLQRDPNQFLHGTGDSPEAGAGLSAAQIEELIERRVEARKHKDWAEADRIRDLLVSQRIVLEDGVEGTRWRRI